MHIPLVSAVVQQMLCGGDMSPREITRKVFGNQIQCVPLRVEKSVAGHFQKRCEYFHVPAAVLKSETEVQRDDPRELLCGKEGPSAREQPKRDPAKK